MHKRFLAASLIAALAVSTTGMVASGQDAEPQVESLTGTVIAVVDTEGVTEYFLELADGTQVKLDMGPAWFWTSGGPLAGLVGQEVTLGGHLSDGVPNENASDVAKEHATGEEAFDVHFINGEPLWITSRPPWAGGPAVVGETHPGFEGWSMGQAAAAAHETDDDDVETADAEEAEAVDGQAMAAARKGGPKVAGESHPGYKGWSKGQANRAAHRAAAQERRAAAQQKAESARARGESTSAAAREGHGRP